MLGSVLCHEHEVPAPLVLDPHGVVILVVRTHRQHDFGGIQGGEDIGLVFLPQLILQGNPGEEDPVALFHQSVVNVLGQDAVQGTVAFVIGFLVADKNIVRLLLDRDLDNTLAQLLNLLGLLPVDLPGDHIRIFHGLVKIAVIQDAFKGGTVAGGDLLPRCRVIHILNAVFAQHQTPVGLGLLRKLRHDGFVDSCRLVKLAGCPQAIGPGEKGQLLLVILIRHCLAAAAVFALSYSGAGFDHQVAAAHFTLDYGHYSLPRFLVQELSAIILQFCA